MLKHIYGYTHYLLHLNHAVIIQIIEATGQSSNLIFELPASLLRRDSFETLRKSVILAKVVIHRICKRV